MFLLMLQKREALYPSNRSAKNATLIPSFSYMNLDKIRSCFFLKRGFGGKDMGGWEGREGDKN